jgi:hypothetical protein
MPLLAQMKELRRLDLQANSELRMCHYQTHQLFTLKGPLKAAISRDGVTAENGKAVVASAGSCAAPTASVFQAGFVSRGVPARRCTSPSVRPL